MYRVSVLLTFTSFAPIKPSPLASDQVYGTVQMLFSGYPAWLRVVAPERGMSMPLSSFPSVTSLFLLCEPPTVKSHAKLRRSTSCAFTDSSAPAFLTDPRFLRMLPADAAADGAMLRLSSASFVCL